MDTHRVAVAGGVRLALDTWPGDGPGLLLVHGLASNARLWDGVAAHLAGLGHAVAAVDQRGHGRSDKPDGGYDFATVCDDLVAVVAALAAGLGGDGIPWTRPVVVGQSWGANVVIELAFREPALTRGVGCVDGGTSDLASRFDTWEACAAALAPPPIAGTPAAELEAMIRRSHPDWPEAGLAGTMANFEVRADGTAAPWLSREHHMAILRSMYEQRPSTRFPAISVPVLFLPADNGDRARTAAKREGVDQALAAIPEAAAHWFAPADHDVHAQFPAEVAGVLHRAVTDGFWA
ncbi:MAG: alpha/beta fold hydrolase [Acidimicrobiales bacterium]